jgi:hypothetical protein
MHGFDWLEHLLDSVYLIILGAPEIQVAVGA